MFLKFWQKAKSEEGFTLVELLIVIVVLGILAGIGIPTYNNVVNRARRAELDVASRTLRLALEMYRMDHGDYPTKDDDDNYLTDLDAVKALLDNPDYVESWPDGVTVVEYSDNGGTISFTLRHEKVSGDVEY